MGLDNARLEEVCQAAAQGEVVAPANFNSPGQVVIAGHVGAVQRAVELAREAGAKRALPLPVSAPFHCSLMQPAAERLARVLADIAVVPLTVPVVSNVEARPNSDAEAVRELLVKQVCAPVRWEASVNMMADAGVERFVEIGPGKVLAGLIKRIVRKMPVDNVGDVAGLKALKP
jgi:[acyl-carrier-protein] S-malonyltransferase